MYDLINKLGDGHACCGCTASYASGGGRTSIQRNDEDIVTAGG